MTSLTDEKKNTERRNAITIADESQMLTGVCKSMLTSANYIQFVTV